MRQENSQKMEWLTAYPDLSKMGELTGLWIDEISYANLTKVQNHLVFLGITNQSYANRSDLEYYERVVTFR